MVKLSKELKQKFAPGVSEDIVLSTLILEFGYTAVLETQQVLTKIPDESKPKTRKRPSPTSTTDESKPKTRKSPSPTSTTDESKPKTRKSPSLTSTTDESKPKTRKRTSPASTTDESKPKTRKRTSPASTTDGITACANKTKKKTDPSFDQTPMVGLLLFIFLLKTI